MDNGRTTTSDGDAANAEPALTQLNTETVRGEETLADAAGIEDLSRDTSTRTKTGAIPSSYGAAGGTTDATEEGGDGTGI